MEPGEFQGTISKYSQDATAWWPPLLRPPEGAPNILVVVIDDVGFAQLGCFGSDLDTPTFDRLAAGGLRYTNFHTTALCSPTRACVLTGRNHHSVGMGRVADLATGFPGYDARPPKSAAFLPRMLVDRGYATYGVGKWHLTPMAESHLGARRDRWPLARGFERFYGYFGGETSQFAPELFHDNHFVSPPATYDEGYHLSEDLADRAIEFLTDLCHVDPDKPWFTYLATGACHSPHQSPLEWRERYRGRFDRGWDRWRDETFARQKAMGVMPDHAELSPRPDWVPEWDSLSDRTREVYARYMEAFAAFLSHADAQVGRVVDWLEETGQLDDTIVIVLSDNGASSEGGETGSLNDARAWNMLPRTVEEASQRLDEIGGPRIHNNYPWGWTVAGNTPFKRWKRETHEGGVCDPMIVHWPARITDGGGLRNQFVHAIDITPTLLDVTGIEAPTEVDGVRQRPIEGVSFAETFADADAPERHTVQYFEMFGCRALYQDGWKAVTYHEMMANRPGLEHAPWELYDLRADPSECHDLAEAEPERLAAMIDRWWEEAEKYQVLPLDNQPFSKFVFERPTYVGERTRFEIWPGRRRIPEDQAPDIRNRVHVVTAHVRVPEPMDNSVEGVLLVQGSVLGGWSFHVVDGRLTYVHNLSGLEEHRIDAALPALAPGVHQLEMRYAPGPPATVTLVVDGTEIGDGVVSHPTLTRFSLTDAGVTAGYATGIPPADGDYQAPFAFTGEIDKVVVVVEGDPYLDPVAEAEIAIARE